MSRPVDKDVVQCTAQEHCQGEPSHFLDVDLRPLLLDKDGDYKFDAFTKEALCTEQTRKRLGQPAPGGTKRFCSDR
eukprot:s153_g25.t1